MRWSWRIARIAGIGIYVHATFPLLLAWVALVQYRAAGTARATAVALVFVLAIFAIVVLHELGHAFAARRYGIATRDITLLPIGGVARLERMPRDPRQELVVALAGPAVNVALALVLLLLLLATGGVRPTVGDVVPGDTLAPRPFAHRMLAVNVLLVAFNLIPAFPMDGGRVLRALLAWRGNHVRATEIAVRVGRFFALVFGVVGLLVVQSPMLVFIALFVWLGAASEASAVRTSVALEGVPIRSVMIQDVRTLAPADPLSRAVSLILGGFQQDFPVLDEHGRIVGVLTRSALLQALGERGDSAPVEAVMQREFLVADPSEPVEEALARLKGCACQALPVVSGRELLGVLTLENVGEYVMVQTALRSRR